MKKIIVFYTMAVFLGIFALMSCEKVHKEATNRHPEDKLYWHYIQRNDSVWDSIRVVRFDKQIWTAYDRPYDNTNINKPWPTSSTGYSTNLFDISKLSKTDLFSWWNDPWNHWHTPSDPNNKTPYVYGTGNNQMSNWYAFMQCETPTEPQTQGICPKGFHVPSAQEWDQLESYLWYTNSYFADVSGSIANALATNNSTTGFNNWRIDNTIGTPGYGADRAENNSANFNIHPVGTVNFQVEKDEQGNPTDTVIKSVGVGRMAVYATSTTMETCDNMYCTRIFYYNSPSIGKGAMDKRRFARVRCVMDDYTKLDTLGPNRQQ